MRTNEELNRVIAEWCGMLETVTEMRSRVAGGPVNCIPAWVAYNAKGETIGLTSTRDSWAPDYCNDLNAIHEAEKRLINPMDNWSGGDKMDKKVDKLVENSTNGTPYTWHLTARQRAEILVEIIEEAK